MQKLYETHKVLTYPRTDSKFIGGDIFKEVPELIKTSLSLLQNSGTGPVFNFENLPKTSINDEKASSHHAIIPTGKKPDSLNEEENNVFQTVLKRFLAAFLPECIKSITTYEFKAGEYLFGTSGTVINSPGWRILSLKEDSSNNTDSENNHLPNISENETLKILKKGVDHKKTSPPPILTDEKLLDLMLKCGKDVELTEEEIEAIKDKGIGTPVTRSGIIEILIKRGYVTRDKKHLLPTAIGLALYQKIKNLKIANPELTGEWEYQLLQIERGLVDRKKFRENINQYCSEVVQELLEVGKRLQNDLEGIEKENSIKCPQCRKGFLKDFGKSFSCSEYKHDCKFILWKTIAGKKLTPSNVEVLIKKGKTGLIKGFTSKTKKKFDAVLLLKNGKVEFEFSKTAKC